MRTLDAIMTKKLGFPDADVEKMEFLPQEKSLKIFIDKAVLDVEGGIELKNGVLFFNGWESLSFRIYDSTTDKWSDVNELAAEKLEDICEAKFTESTVSLCGFSKQSGKWLEWTIVMPQMHAEFEV